MPGCRHRLEAFRLNFDVQVDGSVGPRRGPNGYISSFNTETRSGFVTEARAGRVSP
jgi:hypothetical protein